MQGKVQEEWIQMCEQAAIEQDSEKLMALITEINRMLDEKEQRLNIVRMRRTASNAGRGHGNTPLLSSPSGAMKNQSVHRCLLAGKTSRAHWSTPDK